MSSQRSIAALVVGVASCAGDKGLDATDVDDTSAPLGADPSIGMSEASAVLYGEPTWGIGGVDDVARATGLLGSAGAGFLALTKEEASVGWPDGPLPPPAEEQPYHRSILVYGPDLPTASGMLGPAQVKFRYDDTSRVVLPGDIDGTGSEDMVLTGLRGGNTTFIALAAGPFSVAGPSSVTEATIAAAGPNGVASALDINLDGEVDFAVYAPYDDTSGEDAGAVWFVQGPLLPGEVANDAMDILPMPKGALLGGWASRLDGLSADGGVRYSVACGACVPPDGGGTGRVWLFDAGVIPNDVSSASAEVWAGETADWLPRGEPNGGDMDGDGLRDLFLGADFHDEEIRGGGAVYVFLAPIEGSLGTYDADLVVQSWESDAWLGGGYAGDFNGDGHGDVWIDVNNGNSDYTDVLGVLYGPLQPYSTGVDTRFPGDDALVPGAIHPIGDLDGDGIDDMVLTNDPSYEEVDNQAGVPVDGWLAVFYGRPW
jgi:hypothetical protein